MMSFVVRTCLMMSPLSWLPPCKRAMLRIVSAKFLAATRAIGGGEAASARVFENTSAEVGDDQPIDDDDALVQA